MVHYFLDECHLQSVGHVPVTDNCKGINKISVPRETTGFAVNLRHICITLAWWQPLKPNRWAVTMPKRFQPTMSYSPLSLKFRAKIQTRDSSVFHCSALCSEVNIIVALQRFGFKGCY